MLILILKLDNYIDDKRQALGLDIRDKLVSEKLARSYSEPLFRLHRSRWHHAHVIRCTGCPQY